jgi:hypothetical protein
MKLTHAIWITVSANGSITFEILLHAADSPETYNFANWSHLLAHFGTMLVLTDCEIKIIGTPADSEPIGC